VKFKTDENVPLSVARRLRIAGHDVLTVRDQSLTGRSDSDIAKICTAEGRAIVTEDLGFADIRSYPPKDHAGIILLRMPSPDRYSAGRLIELFLTQFTADSLHGKLIIVEPGRMRIRE
jgi:predicted nuclease of predicted toxin-antitoxin system